MRLFLAINLPAGERERIHEATAPLRRAALPVRWVAPENLHLTLAFLGEVPEPTVARIRDAVARAVRGIARFDVRIRGIGAFPDARRPRVIWVGVDDAPPLRRLHAALEAALASLGFAADERGFHPHVTLGRVRDRARPRELAPFAELASAIAYQGMLPARSVDLMRSETGPGGARYERIGAAALG